MFERKYIFGDTAIYFREVPLEGHEGKQVVGLAVYPAAAEIVPQDLRLDSLIQVSFAGDASLVDYTAGVTMRNRSSVLVHVLSQEADEEGVVTLLADDAGNRYTHTLRYFAKTGVFSMDVVYENASDEVRTLEYLASGSISGIACPQCGNTVGMALTRMTSAWSRECRIRTDSFAHLGLDMSWARYGVKCEKWGEVGSMANRGYYPFAALSCADYTLAATLEAPASWQMEVYLEKEMCAFSAGLGDYEFAHWRKEILPGECFASEKMFFTCKGDLLSCCNALVHEQDSRLCVPPAEEKMPVLFNEYCTTWGCPSQENIAAILEALRPFPVDIFVIDCGWYKPDDKGWGNAIGDWIPSKTLFPAGIGAVADAIRAEGMIPGIWYEFEVAGRDSECFSREDMLLHRDGMPLTMKNRRFLDLRLERVDRYLKERFLRLLRENRFGYLKIDYNDSIGIGCDSEDGSAPGEGGRQVALESLRWLDRIKAAVPDIILENCSSGGSRIEPLRMSKVSMCSFSDAHECDEIPFVAANVTRVVPARQVQIWAVLRAQESLSRTIYSLCAAMLGRICLSGDVLGMREEKRECILRGLAFYRKICDIVRDGDIVGIDCNVEYYRAPKGRQIYTKQLGGRRLVIVHSVSPDEICIPTEGYRIADSFASEEYVVADGTIRFPARTGAEHCYRAAAMLLERCGK